MNLFRIACKVAGFQLRDGTCPCGIDAASCDYHRDDPKYNKLASNLQLKNELKDLIHQYLSIDQEIEGDHGHLDIIVPEELANDRWMIEWVGELIKIVKISGVSGSYKENTIFEFDRDQAETELDKTILDIIGAMSHPKM